MDTLQRIEKYGPSSEKLSSLQLELLEQEPGVSRQEVVGAMRSHLLAGTYIQADETPVDVQTHDGSGSNHQAYLWQYGTPGGMTVFDFQMSRKREGPLNFLGNFEGLLQTDGYAAYDRLE